MSYAMTLPSEWAKIEILPPFSRNEGFLEQNMLYKRFISSLTPSMICNEKVTKG